MTDVRVWSVTTTTPDRDSAVRLGRAVVAEHLAAGAEISGPAASIFWHLGELGEGEEWRLTLRTSTASRALLVARLGEIHPWQSPEISAMALTWCTDTYAEWVERITTQPKSGRLGVDNARRRHGVPEPGTDSTPVSAVVTESPQVNQQ